MSDLVTRDVAANMLIDGETEADVLFADTGLSFWGGVDPESGTVIDRTHPLAGHNVAGKILALPSGRGSCTGSSVMLQLLMNGKAPAGMIFARREEILSLGVIVAEEMFGRSIPMLEVGASAFACLRDARRARMAGGKLTILAGRAEPTATSTKRLVPDETPADLVLSARDHLLLAESSAGMAVATAMRIIVRMARLLGSERLIDVTRAHIDGCIYTGPASLAFAEQLRDRGGRVAIPTTLNAISVDQAHWRTQGTDPRLGVPASALADAYLDMGAIPTFTCAPYQADSIPARGEDVAWAESNAVVYANSVLGARTMKYPDYLDICVALTGRAPLSGCHIEANRRPVIRIAVSVPRGFDDAFYPLLGYHIGKLAPAEIPLVTGLETLTPTLDDLKAFGAAFGTTSAAPMFHISGITPEAMPDSPWMLDIADLPALAVGPTDPAISWDELNSAAGDRVDLVSLGNPHFSFDEVVRLATLCRDRDRHPDVAIVVTLGRSVHARIVQAGLDVELQRFGVRFVRDACWCMVGEPVIPPSARVIMTNSGKYAHYGPGLTGRLMRFAALSACVDAACSGKAPVALPEWLVAGG